MQTENQSQTKDTFGYKWNRQETYEGKAFLTHWKFWLMEKYFDNDTDSLDRLFQGKKLRILDAGCGAGVSSDLLFGDRLKAHEFIAVDISDAIYIAKQRFEAKGVSGKFVQADLANLPSNLGDFDLIFSEGVLHHTDSVGNAIQKLSDRLRPSGVLMFYVYVRKAPVREFTDDLIREHISTMSNDEAWNSLVPLTKLGRALGELDTAIEVEDDIPYLGIKRGRHDIQRLFFYCFVKAFYNREFSLEQMNHINFDWFRPKNCHRHSPQEIRKFCEDADLSIERLHEGPSGLTVIARKAGE